MIPRKWFLLFAVSVVNLVPWLSTVQACCPAPAPGKAVVNADQTP
jgi:hypothetical protein